MPWKEPYKTRTGEKRYKIVTKDPRTGKKTSKSFVRSKDADAYMLELTRQEQLGHLWTDKPTTFGEFAGLELNDKGRVVLTGDGWFSRYKSTVRLSSYDRRRSIVNHLKDFLPMRIERITPGIVEDLTHALHDETPRQAKFVDETIKMVLRAAKVRGQRVNPDVFEVRSPAYEPARRRVSLGLADVEMLADESTEPHLIRTAAYTGLRQGELFALRDEDVDLKAKTITVAGTAYNGKRYDRPKTKAGQRTIPLAQAAVVELRLQLMRRVQGTGLVFPSPSGKVWWADNFNDSFRDWVQGVGLDITFHDLRHTFASMMVKGETHPKVLQEILGHANFGVTMDLYTHLEDEQKRSAVTSLQAIIDKGV